ncbi:MAG: DUF6545 domain-containing protein, partial [Pseudonocardiaceae bacterium]
EQARQHVTTNDLSKDQIEPTITACWLEVARQAKMQGIPPCPNSFAFIACQGEDLSSEIDFLLEIARARRLPLVVSFSLPQITLHSRPSE